MNVFISLLLCLIVGLFTMIGLIFVFKSKKDSLLIDFSIALAFSVLITLGCLEILPESYELISGEFSGITSYIITFLITISGVCLLKLIDLFVPNHSHEGKHNNNVLKHIAIITAVAILIHNVIEGASLYSSFIVSFKTGLVFSFGIALHNIAVGLLIGTGLYKSNNNKKKTFIFIFLISISTFVGAVLMAIFNLYLESNLILGIILSLTLGMILYISLLELLPLVVATKSKKVSSIGLVLGIIIMILTMLMWYNYNGG